MAGNEWTGVVTGKSRQVRRGNIQMEPRGDYCPLLAKGERFRSLKEDGKANLKNRLKG